MSERFLNLTEENLAQEHLCCIIRSKLHPRFHNREFTERRRAEAASEKIRCAYGNQKSGDG